MAEVDTERAEQEEAGSAEASDEVVPESGLADAPVHEAGGHVHTGPEPSAYVGIGIILAIVTAAEVALYYVEDAGQASDTVITLSLLVLMAVKFFLVALWYMHLKFESPLFRWLFYGGIVLATSVYAIVLAASHVFPILV